MRTFVLNRQQARQLWYVPLLAAAMGLMLLRTLLLARLLPLPEFAVFAAGLLASSTFGMLGCLGLQSLLQRELPVQLVRGRGRAGAVLLMQCVLVAFACAGIGLVAAAAGFSIAGLGTLLVVAGTLHGLSQQLFLLATVDTRSRGRPLQFSLQNLARSVAVLGAGAGVAALFGSALAVLLAEALVTAMVTQAVAVGIWRRARVGAAALQRIAWHRLPRLRWGSAFALLAVTIVGFGLLNADRWIAAEALPQERFAQYAFAWTLLMIGQSVQAVVNASAYPMLARRFAVGDRLVAFRLCLRISTALMAACALFAWPAWWLLDASVGRWYPLYAPARELLTIFLLVAALRLSDFWSSFLVIVGLERLLLLVNLGVGAVVLTAWSLWVDSEPGNDGLSLLQAAVLAAGLTTVGYVATALTAWGASRRRTVP